MNEECTDLKKTAAEASDKHYRAMTDWAVSRRDPEKRRIAHRFALAYRKSLEWLINCYSRIRNRKSAEAKMETAIEFKNMVDQDVQLLEKNP